MKQILLLLIAVALLSAKTPFEANGQLHVDSATGKLMTEEGRAVQLRGMSSHGIHWFGGMINETSIRALEEDWRADILRISTYVQEGGYEKSPSVVGFVDNAVELATAQGLYVIIDFHMLAPGNPWYNVEYAKDFFSHMASAHGDKQNIFYEICNEPNNEGGKVKNYYTGQYETFDTMTVTWDTIKSYAEEIIPIIRQHDDHNIILVGTPNWCQDVNEVIDNRLDDPNLMYTTHFYAASHLEYERGKLREALEANVPVFVSEFGSQTYSGDGANDFESTEEWFALLDSFNVSWVNWNFSYHNFSGAVFTKFPGDLKNYDFYTSESSLKTAGKWIKAKLQLPDAWEETAVSSPVTVQEKGRAAISCNKRTLNLSNVANGSEVALYTLQGERVWKSKVKGSAGAAQLTLPAAISSGQFVATITIDGVRTSSLITVR